MTKSKSNYYPVSILVGGLWGETGAWAATAKEAAESCLNGVELVHCKPENRDQRTVIVHLPNSKVRSYMAKGEQA